MMTSLRFICVWGLALYCTSIHAMEPALSSISRVNSDDDIIDVAADLEQDKQEHKNQLLKLVLESSDDELQDIVTQDSALWLEDSDDGLVAPGQKDQRLTIVKRLLEQKANVSSAIFKATSALYVATTQKNKNLCALLQAQNAHMHDDESTRCKTEYIHALISNNHELIDFWKDIIGPHESLDTENNTALHIACDTNNLDVVCDLLKKGADYTLFNNKGLSPLSIASTQAHSKIVYAILETMHCTHTEKPLSREYTSTLGNILYNAIILQKNADVIRLLIAFGASLDPEQYPRKTALQVAHECRNGPLGHEIIGIIQLVGNSFATKQTNPLYIASKNGYGGFVNVLLKNGNTHLNTLCCDLRTHDHCTALCAAVKNGHERSVDLLLSHNADPNIICDIAGKRKTALLEAVHKQYKTIVSLLLKAGAHTNILCDGYNNPTTDARYQYTALHCAVHFKYYGILHTLLQKTHFCDLLVCDSDGKTILHEAKDACDYEATRIILERLGGTDYVQRLLHLHRLAYLFNITMPGALGYDLIHEAQKHGHDELIKVLTNGDKTSS